MSTRSSVPVPRPIKLAQGSSPQPHTILSTLHFTLALLALLIKLPFYLVWHFILFRHHSPLTRVAGRHPLAETIYHIAKCIFNDFPLPASRAVFATQLFLRRDKWIERVTAPEGVDGVWIRPPRAGKEPDDLVLFWIHGGAFNHDIIGSNMLFYKSLARNVNDHSGSPRAFSIFVLDYHLAPETIYPSQLIEVQAGYRYLTRTLGIPSDKICIGGDSAGGNLVVSFLLHLVEPNVRLEAVSPALERPASVLLMSPWLSLLPLASRPSRSSQTHSGLDFLTTPSVTLGAYQYLGVEVPFRAGPSWNPLRWFGLVRDEMPKLEDENGAANEKFDDMYVSPGPETVQNWDLYGKALPHDGKTCVVWGGMEIFADDVEAFVRALKSVEVNPVELFSPVKCHDWPLFDFTFPLLARTKSGGESNKYDFGVQRLGEFLREVSVSKRQA